MTTPKTQLAETVDLLVRRLIADDAVATAELVLQVMSLVSPPDGIEPWFPAWQILVGLTYHVGLQPHQAPQVGRIVDEYLPSDCPRWATNLVRRLELDMHQRCAYVDGIAKCLRLEGRP